MNEVIHELKKQCYVEKRKGTNAFDSYVVTIFDTEKFARLIIEDCIRITHSKTDDSVKVAHAIETHFGLDQ